MTRGCTIGRLSTGSKVLIGVAIAGAAATAAIIVYKRSKQPGMSPGVNPSAVHQPMQTVMFQPMHDTSVSSWSPALGVGPASSF